MWDYPIFLKGFLSQEDFVSDYGAPAEVWLQVDGAVGSTALNFTFTLVNKTATRLVEAHWVQFYPAVEGSLADWSVDKVREGLASFRCA